MPPAVTRSLKITYGSTYVGGDSTYLIHGPVRLEKSYAAFRVSFQVVVQNDTASTFKSNCATLEAAFRTPRQDLTIEMEGQTFVSYSHSGNTGFLSEPGIVNAGDTAADTGRSRLYDVSVAVQLPADLTGQSGRADSTVTLDYDAARRRRITIAGRYTALGGNSASDQYEASIGSYASSILSSLGSGGTFDLIREDEVPDDADKNCAFVREYQEVLYAPTSGGLSHASIRGATTVYSRRRPAPGDSPDKAVKRLEEVTVAFSCSVDNDVSTSLESLYGDSVRPYVLSQAATLFGASATAVVDESRTFDKSANTISAVLDLRMVIGGGVLIEYSRAVAVEDEKGVLLQPAWDGASRYAKRKFAGIGRRVRTTTSIERALGVWSLSGDGGSFVGGGAPGGAGGGAGAKGGKGKGAKAATQQKPGAAAGAGQQAAPAASPGGVGAEPIGGQGWELMRTRRAVRALRLGIDGATIDATDCETVIEEEWHTEPGGGGGPVVTPSQPNVRGPFAAPGGAVTG